MTLNKFMIPLMFLILIACIDDGGNNNTETPRDMTGFYFGADLSYVNQVVDKGGTFREGGSPDNPYAIFRNHGTNLVRLRLWHSPAWTQEVYGEQGTQWYNDMHDVAKSIELAHANGMEVLLDFHYSDRWADPDSQDVPEAWAAVKTIDDLEDSVYNYTKKVLTFLNGKSLMPEWVQIGNEINCGMLYSAAGAEFPTLRVCGAESKWADLGKIIRAGIKAVDDVAATSTVKTKVMLHVADPKNVEWWFDNITTTGGVTDFDMIAISYYPLWHTEVKINQLSDKIALLKNKFKKPVIIVETAYPWTTEGDDSYNNLLGGSPISGLPFTPQGQYDFMVILTQEVVDGGGAGVVYWEPAWISSNLKDLWGTGSAWENATFFNFDGDPVRAMDYPFAVYR